MIPPNGGGRVLFAETLRELRQRRKLSQKQFAKEIFISPSAVSQYETGRTTPSRENLERIARFFSVSVDYLMGNSTIADIEELMNEEYCDDISVAELIEKCVRIRGKQRETLLTVISALELYCSDNGGNKD